MQRKFVSEVIHDQTIFCAYFFWSILCFKIHSTAVKKQFHTSLYAYIFPHQFVQNTDAAALKQQRNKQSKYSQSQFLSSDSHALKSLYLKVLLMEVNTDDDLKMIKKCYSFIFYYNSTA